MAIYTIIRVYEMPADTMQQATDRMAEAIVLHVDRDFHGIHLGFSQLMHNLALTRVLVAASIWATKSPDLNLSDVRTCCEMGHSPRAFDGETREKKEKLSAIPDGWLLFEKLKKGVREYVSPVLLETDLGTMQRLRFKRHMLSSVECVESGEYRRVFGQEAVVIA